MTNGPRSKGHSRTNKPLLFDAHFHWWYEHSSNAAILDCAILSIVVILALWWCYGAHRVINAYAVLATAHATVCSLGSYAPDSIAPCSAS